jgi:hypothetical protein
VDFTLPNVSVLGFSTSIASRLFKIGSITIGDAWIACWLVQSTCLEEWESHIESEMSAIQFSDYAGSRRAAWEQRVSVYVPLDGE